MKYLFFLLFAFFSVSLNAQIISPFKNEGGYISYKELSQTLKKDGKYVDGDYYILITADWCAPCQELKRKLKESKYFEKKIADVNFDSEGELSAKLMTPKRTIPQLIRYRITENGKKVVKSFRDSESLEEFFKK